MAMTSPTQLRAGRALAQISQVELARCTGLSVPTIAGAEQGYDCLASTVDAMQTALEAAGVAFLADGSVRLGPPRGAVFLSADPDNPPDRATMAAAARVLNVRRRMRSEPLLREDGE